MKHTTLWLVTLLPCIYAFYLPGASPQEYEYGEKVPLLVNAVSPLSESGSPIKAVGLSYDFYHPSFHHCEPVQGIRSQPEALGSIIFGDRLFNSAFDIRAKQNATCQILCPANVPSNDAVFVNERISESYSHNWLIDGLPAGKAQIDSENDIFYSIGFELGQVEGSQPHLNNHFDILIEWHARPNGRLRVVGVAVWPSSHSNQGNADCTSPTPLALSENQDTSFAFTYSIMWRESPKPWASRWDSYLKLSNSRIHWFALINAFMVAIFLVLMIATILSRILQKDIARYNALDLSEEVQEESGWKLCHAEVFRPPRYPMLLSVAVGSGIQLTAMVACTMFFALLGFLSPSNRGGLSTFMLVLWTCLGFVGGYSSARLYASLKGQAWKQNLLATATLFPLVLFGLLFFLNFFLIIAGSSGAVPFGTMLAILGLWFGVSTPLTFLGGYFGARTGPIVAPVTVNVIPRQIPPTPKYLKTWPCAVLAGVFTFAAGFIELFFIFNSLFASKTYYAFGFLSLDLCILLCTAATITVLMSYFRLVAENYRWHWASLIIGGGSSIWVLIYGLFYWATKLSLNSFASRVLYLGYLLIISLIDGLVTASTGFAATYLFMLTIYGNVRVD